MKTLSKKLERVFCEKFNIKNMSKRGSIWRKWDLHFHTPSSYDYENKKVTNEEIIKSLHDNNVSVVAITDHNTIDVNRISDLQQIGQKYEITVLPGIEFLSDTRGTDPIHFIGIFPEDCNLSFIWGQLQHNTNLKLIEGQGKKHNEVYCDLFETIEIIKKNNGIVSIHAGAKSNSIENITHSLPHGSAQKIDIANAIDIYELGKETDQDGYKKIVFPAIKKNIPMIICSDNHNINEYKVKANCWIKADPTFEGLKQIIYEPEQRVYIGENPDTISSKLKLDKLKIKNSSGFHLVDQEIEFNSNLVSIIGGRGAGKSALLETLTFCFGQNKTGDYGGDYSDDFLINEYIEYFRINGHNATVEINYKDLDNKDLPIIKKEILDKSEEYCNYPLMYLGQNQIEDFANDSNKIHELAFDAVLKNSGFSDEITSIQNEIKSNEADLISLTKEIEGSRLQLLSYNIDKVKSEKLRLEKELALLSSDETKEILATLNNSRKRKENANRVGEILNDYVKELHKFKDSVKQKEKTVNELLPMLDIKDVFLENNLNEISKNIEIVKNKIDALNISESYEKTLTEVETQLNGKTDISATYFESLKSSIEQANKTILLYKNEEEYLEKCLSDRFFYLKNFDELYKDLRDSYSEAIEAFSVNSSSILKSVKLESKVTFNLGAVVKSLFEKVDRRKVKNIEKFKQDVLKMDIVKGFKYSDWIKEFQGNESNWDYFYDGRKTFEEIAFTNPYKLQTSISYEISENSYKTLNNLSLGQKGTVLLKLFLSIGNNCPIVIDQPEDHLDNHFIYTDLVSTLKNAKKKRQIILVTHDANIVVNGDSEQVIVAEYLDGKINYNLSGALENPDIRKAVTKILEGGEEAFINRNKKYRFVN